MKISNFRFQISGLYRRPHLQNGYTLAAALLMIAILSILMAMSLPIWERVKQREKEEELIFRGKEYTEAIARYHVKFNSYPPDLETLHKQKFIRRLYKDPMTESGKWKVLRPDSLVETGEAGAINQPGANQNNNQEGEQNEAGKIPSGFGQRTQETEQEPIVEESLTEEADSAEEPETEVIGPVAGVVSRSKKASIRTYNGQTNYNKWVFVHAVQQQQQPEPPKGGKQDQKDKAKPKKQPKPTDKNSQELKNQ